MNTKKRIIVLIAMMMLSMLLLTACGEEDHDDGKCDICGKTATYSGSDEEYCDKHLESAVEWYIKQGEDD